MKGFIAGMDKDEIEKKARAAMVAAGDMAAKGVEWVRNYREAHRESQSDEAVRDGDRRIYGVTDLAPQNTGFRAFNAFRLMITPMIIRIAWLVGAYIAYPITMISILGSMSKNRYVTSGDMWKVFGVSILILIAFRLSLESLMAIFRIHESTTKMTDLVGRLVQIEEHRQSAAPKGAKE